MSQETLFSIYQYLNQQGNHARSAHEIACATSIPVKNIRQCFRKMPHLFIRSTQQSSLYALNRIAWSEATPERVIKEDIARYKRERLLSFIFFTMTIASIVLTISFSEVYHRLQTVT